MSRSKEDHAGPLALEVDLVSEIILHTLEEMNPHYPKVTRQENEVAQRGTRGQETVHGRRHSEDLRLCLPSALWLQHQPAHALLRGQVERRNDARDHAGLGAGHRVQEVS